MDIFPNSYSEPSFIQDQYLQTQSLHKKPVFWTRVKIKHWALTDPQIISKEIGLTNYRFQNEVFDQNRIFIKSSGFSFPKDKFFLLLFFLFLNNRNFCIKLKPIAEDFLLNLTLKQIYSLPNLNLLKIKTCNSFSLKAY